MKPLAKLAFALAIVATPVSAVLVTGCAPEGPAPAAAQAVQQYVVTVAGMT